MGLSYNGMIFMGIPRISRHPQRVFEVNPHVFFFFFRFHPPTQMSIHSMVSMGSCRVGPELRVTSADGQIIKQMQFDDDKVGSWVIHSLVGIMG